MTAEELDAIEARLTAGVQWTPDQCEIEVRPDGYVFVPECACIGETIIQQGGHYEDYQDDWVFVAHSREDMRRLVEEVRRLRKVMLV